MQSAAHHIIHLSCSNLILESVGQTLAIKNYWLFPRQYGRIESFENCGKKLRRLKFHTHATQLMHRFTCVAWQDGGKPRELQRSAVTQRLDPNTAHQSCVSELCISKFVPIHISVFWKFLRSCWLLIPQCRMEWPDWRRDLEHGQKHNCELHRWLCVGRMGVMGLQKVRGQQQREAGFDTP